VNDSSLAETHHEETRMIYQMERPLRITIITKKKLKKWE